MSPAAARSVRQIRADGTRVRIFVAASELFSERGYGATTVERICAKAGVAKGTFFIYFPTKDAVIADLVRNQVRAARKARATALKGGKGPLEALRDAVMTLGVHAGTSRTLSRAVLAGTLESREAGGQTAALFDELYAEMRVDARAAKKAGILATHADPDALASSLMASYLGCALHFTTATQTKPLVDLLAPLVEMNLAGAIKPAKAKEPRHANPLVRARRARVR